MEFEASNDIEVLCCIIRQRLVASKPYGFTASESGGLSPFYVVRE